MKELDSGTASGCLHNYIIVRGTIQLPRSQTIIQSQSAYITITLAWMMIVWYTVRKYVSRTNARNFVCKLHQKSRAIQSFHPSINNEPTPLFKICQRQVLELHKTIQTLSKLFRITQWLLLHVVLKFQQIRLSRKQSPQSR